MTSSAWLSRASRFGGVFKGIGYVTIIMFGSLVMGYWSCLGFLWIFLCILLFCNLSICFVRVTIDFLFYF